MRTTTVMHRPAFLRKGERERRREERKWRRRGWLRENGGMERSKKNKRKRKIEEGEDEGTSESGFANDKVI